MDLEEEGVSDGWMVDGVHTPDNPYCDDLACWCHTDWQYHGLVTHPMVTDEQIEWAYEFFELKGGSI